MFAVHRLAVASLRARPGNAVLVAAVFAAVAAVACTALAVQDSAGRAWDAAFERTRGAHVRFSAPSPGAAAKAVARTGGGVETSEPWGTSYTQLRAGGRVVALALTARGTGARVDSPVAVEGEGLADGPGIVVERSFARALGVRPGSPVEVRRADGTWSPTSVRGVVASVVAGPYPMTVPGRAFATPGELARLGAPLPQVHTVSVRLSDPRAVPVTMGPGPGEAMASDWRSDRAEALAGTEEFQVILAAFALLLLASAAAVAGATVSGRMAANRRLVGLVRAVGCTPAQAGAALVLEYGVAAAAGSSVGVAVAALTLPAAVRAALPPLGMPPGGLGWTTAAAVAIGVTATAALVAALAGATTARRRPANLLQGPDRERESGLGRWAVRVGLPAAVVLGAKDAFARRARAVTAAGAVAMVVMAAVAALCMEATFDAAAAGRPGPVAAAAPPPPGLPPASILGDEVPVDDATRLRPLVYGLEAVLGFVAVLHLVVTAVLDARERARERAMLAAVGLTPAQLSASRGVAAVAVAAAGAAVGAPLGYGFFRAAYAAAGGAAAEVGDAPALLSVLAAAGAVLLAGVVAALAARVAARSASAAVLALD